MKRTKKEMASRSAVAELARWLVDEGTRPNEKWQLDTSWDAVLSYALSIADIAKRRLGKKNSQKAIREGRTMRAVASHMAKPSPTSVVH